MQTKKVSVTKLFIVSTLLLIFTNFVTYVLLLNKNEEWKMVLADKSMYSSDAFVAADALKEHVYYDGARVRYNQIVRHYNSNGEKTGSSNLGKVLKGDKVVMLLSPNCCTSCATEEIKKLLGLSEKIGREHLVIVADFALHSESSMSENFDKEGFYETDIEHLGIKGSPTQETPVVMLTQNGRVKTSFLVNEQTVDFVDGFHEYLTEYFKRKK